MHDPDTNRLGALPSAAGTITRLAYAAAKRAGLALEPLLMKASLTVREIEDPDARIKVRDQIRFLNLVAEALGDDLLGYRLALVPDLRELGWLYYVAASSEALGDALQRLARYSTIVNEGLAGEYMTNGDLRVLLRYVGVSRHRDRHQMEFLVTILVRLCRHLTGSRLIPTGIKFIHLRTNWSELAEYFGCDPEYGAGVDEVGFSEAVRAMPIVSRDMYLNKLLVSYCEDTLARRTIRRGEFRTSVENAIAPRLPHGKIQAGDVARQFGMSERTFARRLAADGLSFSEILDRLRSDLAERYLAERELTISQIAWLLGYQDSSAFSHAFKRWTGKTPRQARLSARS